MSDQNTITTPIEYAQTYIKRGWPVLPVYECSVDGTCSCGGQKGCSPGKHPRTTHGLKDASTDAAQIKEWWTQWPNANVGVRTGSKDTGGSDFWILDVDPRNGGDLGFDNLTNGEELPETVETETGGGGRQLLFQHPGGYIKSAAIGQDYPGVDIKGDNSYAIFPPSRHRSGRCYEFEASSHPNDVEIANTPKWLHNLLAIKEPIKITKYDLNTETIPDGQRNQRLTSLAGTMRRRGLTETAIAAALKEHIKTQGRPALNDDEVASIAHSVSRYKPITPLLDNERFHKTDLGNANRMIYLHGEELRFVTEWNRWLIWDGNRWAPDRTESIEIKGRDTLKAMYEAGIQILEDDDRSKYMSYVASVEDRSRILAMIRLSSSDAAVAIVPDVLDAHPLLFNTLNGTVDLTTGELRDHDKTDLITKITPIELDPKAKCPKWNAFLTEITEDDAGMLAFLKMAVGWSMTGVLRDQMFFVLYGLGQNGKSTFLDTVMSMMGEYGQPTPVETLLTRRNETIPNDLARLKGARFVSAIEAQEGKRLNESLIKSITGGDIISARFMRQDWFDFAPEFKLWLGTNHKPVIKDSSMAMWRRVRLVPFNYQVPDEKINKNLKNELHEELPGILNWAIDGCLAWQIQGGLEMPDKVQEATNSYKSDMDVIEAFLSDTCVIEPLASLQASVLFGEYKNWCEENNERVCSQRMFGTKLKDKGYTHQRKRDGYYWHGLGLKA